MGTAKEENARNMVADLAAFDFKLPVLIAVRTGLWSKYHCVLENRTLAKSTSAPDAYHITFLIVSCDIMSVFNQGYTFVLNIEALKTFA